MLLRERLLPVYELLLVITSWIYRGITMPKWWHKGTEIGWWRSRRASPTTDAIYWAWRCWDSESKDRHSILSTKSLATDGSWQRLLLFLFFSFRNSPIPKAASYRGTWYSIFLNAVETDTVPKSCVGTFLKLYQNSSISYCLATRRVDFSPVGQASHLPRALFTYCAGSSQKVRPLFQNRVGGVG